MKNFGYMIMTGLVVSAVIIISNIFYIIDETEQVVITQFGKPIGDPIKQSGLHVKAPFIQEVNRFDKRILVWDGDPNQIPTLDKRYIWVDTTARWKIADPLQFLKAFGSESVAQARLDDILDSAVRDAVSGHNLVEVIRNTNDIVDRRKSQPVSDDIDSITTDDGVLERVQMGQNAITRDVLRRGSEKTKDFGIELVDIRIRRINYVQDVLRKVFDRMISERKRAAEQYRSQGQGKKAEIEGKAFRDLSQINSEAYQKSQEISGNADAEAIKIYAEAYNRDPEFYAFLKTLETYSLTIDTNTTLMLSTDSEFFRYLKTIKSLP
ncbi:MAG: protease modulator HflC [Candidatus Omnitrophica bacterium]|nr:protease modulator HflC [Candidatus Omnitrophota bacterium]